MRLAALSTFAVLALPLSVGANASLRGRRPAPTSISLLSRSTASTLSAITSLVARARVRLGHLQKSARRLLTTAVRSFPVGPGPDSTSSTRFRRAHPSARVHNRANSTSTCPTSILPGSDVVRPFDLIERINAIATEEPTSLNRAGWFAASGHPHMELRTSLLATAVTSGLFLQSAAARADDDALASEQEQFETDGSAPRKPDILVVGRRWQEPNIGDLSIETIVDEDEILMLGSDTVGSLVDDLGPRTGSARGAGYSPVILINGRRAASQTEVASLPAEAVKRVEILGEKASQTFGVPPGQPVLNIVLKSDFRTLTITVSEGVATEGGFDKTSATAAYTTIAGPSRLSLQFTALRDSALLESARDIPIEPAPPGIVLAPGDRTIALSEPGFRSLLPANRSLKTSAAYTIPVSGLTSLTIDASVDLGKSEKGLGFASGTILAPLLPGVGFVRRYAEFLPPLGQTVDATNLSLGAQLSGQDRRWNWNAAISIKRSVLETVSDLAPDFAPFQRAVEMGADPLGPISHDLLARGSTSSSRFVTNSADFFASIRGPVLEMPAGAVWLNLNGSLRAFKTTSLSSSAVTSGFDLSREEASVAASLLLPLTASRAEEPGQSELTLGLGLGARAVSDFGRTLDKNLSLTWRPEHEFRLHASLSSRHEVPNAAQLSAPQTITPGVRLYDFLRGETVTVQSIRQGNPDLLSENDRALQIGAVYQPFSKERTLSFTVDFTHETARNPIGFVSSAPQMQFAFPGRFIFDATGRINSIDTSAVNFLRSKRQSLRLGAQWSWPLGRKEFHGASSPSARLTGYITSDWIFADRLRLNRRVSVDYLEGDAKGFPGNCPSHFIEGKLGYVRSGFGAEVSFDWQAASDLRNIATANPQGSRFLHFSDRLQVNLGAHLDLGRIGVFKGAGNTLSGMRLRIGLENLTNSRPIVRRQDGITPYAYGAAILSPQGRVFTVGLRKSF